jgi:hypothetical protein
MPSGNRLAGLVRLADEDGRGEEEAVVATLSCPASGGASIIL